MSLLLSCAQTVLILMVNRDGCTKPGASIAFVSSTKCALFLVEGETDFTSERARGQFSIFGAVEENIGHGFSRFGTGQEPLGGMPLKRVEG